MPKKTFLGPIADVPSSPWFRQALGEERAWWEEQERKVPQFDLIVYEAGNFANGSGPSRKSKKQLRPNMASCLRA